MCSSDVIGGDEDNYGQEMAMYLNDNDIIKPDRPAAGIRRYCTPVAAKTRSKVNREPGILHLLIPVHNIAMHRIEDVLCLA